jgi:AcrR family transcriptional regulator
MDPRRTDERPRPSLRRRGRPLDAPFDRAIGAAAVEVLRRLGYSDLTMDDVAVTAGASKTTIYRRQ